MAWKKVNRGSPELTNYFIKLNSQMFLLTVQERPPLGIKTGCLPKSSPLLRLRIFWHLSQSDQTVTMKGITFNRSFYGNYGFICRVLSDLNRNKRCRISSNIYCTQTFFLMLTMKSGSPVYFRSIVSEVPVNTFCCPIVFLRMLQEQKKKL